MKKRSKKERKGLTCLNKFDIVYLFKQVENNPSANNNQSRKREVRKESKKKKEKKESEKEEIGKWRSMKMM